MNATVYAIGNDVFMAKDMIFGWCVEGNKLGLNAMTPISEIGIERIKILQELYVGPLYPDDLKLAIYEQHVLMAASDVASTAAKEMLASGEVPAPRKLDMNSPVVKWLGDQFAAQFSAELPPPPAEVKVDISPVSKLKPIFRAENFRVREPSLFVFPRVEPHGETGRFIERFGMLWKKIPDHPKHRFMGDKEKQIYVTLWMGDEENPPSIATYHGIPFEQFKDAFLSENFDPTKRNVYVLDVDVEYAGGVAMEKLREEGLWS
jgi:hypothetical protein